MTNCDSGDQPRSHRRGRLRCPRRRRAADPRQFRVQRNLRAPVRLATDAALPTDRIRPARSRRVGRRSSIPNARTTFRVTPMSRWKCILQRTSASTTWPCSAGRSAATSASNCSRATSTSPASRSPARRRSATTPRISPPGFVPSRTHGISPARRRSATADIQDYARETAGAPVPFLEAAVRRTDGRARRLMMEAAMAGRGADQRNVRPRVQCQSPSSPVPTNRSSTTTTWLSFPYRNLWDRESVFRYRKPATRRSGSGRRSSIRCSSVF